MVLHRTAHGRKEKPDAARTAGDPRCRDRARTSARGGEPPRAPGDGPVRRGAVGLTGKR